MLLVDHVVLEVFWRRIKSRQLPTDGAMMQAITGFHQDEQGDWVADLACGHGQHVRHQPPLFFRPWVCAPEGRRRYLGTKLDCKNCERTED